MLCVPLLFLLLEQQMNQINNEKKTDAKYMFYSIALSIIGFVLGSINVFINTKYFSEQEKYPKGYFGILLSSLPVIILMVIIFKFKSN